LHGYPADTIHRFRKLRKCTAEGGVHTEVCCCTLEQLAVAGNLRPRSLFFPAGTPRQAGKLIFRICCQPDMFFILAYNLCFFHLPVIFLFFYYYRQDVTCVSCPLPACLPSAGALSVSFVCGPAYNKLLSRKR